MEPQNRGTIVEKDNIQLFEDQPIRTARDGKKCLTDVANTDKCLQAIQLRKELTDI